jgi:predicted membrane chloride channel (bestrophin family)
MVHSLYGTSYTVTYDSSSHWSILTQQWGSLWPKLLPFCLLNVALMGILHILLAHGIDMHLSEVGHNFMGFVVSFLLVSRVSMGVARYYEARECLENMNKSCRQLVHTACVYSNLDQSIRAKEWRSEICYTTLVLLRSTMAVIDYPSMGIKVLDLPELQGALLEHLLRSNTSTTRWLHEPRSVQEENIRVPTQISYLLRKIIRSQEGRIEPAIPVIAEGDLYAFVNSIMDGYYGLHKFITTPFPFPLLQMSSTFLWFYVFTVPFAMLSIDDNGPLSVACHCAIIFIFTFGFLGMEFVSIQMDDPFGDDENDFNNLSLAHMVFEDVYVTLDDTDGEEWAAKLRQKMNGGQDKQLCNETDWLLNGKV